MKNPRLAILLRAALFMTAFVFVAIAAWKTASVLPPGRGRELIVGLVATAGALGLTVVFTRFDRIALADVGLRVSGPSVVRFSAGFGIGLLLVASTFLLSVLAFGMPDAVANPLATWRWIVLAVLAYVGLSAMEEIGFRGYALRRLYDAFGWWAAQLIIALGFAIYHMAQGWPPMLALIGTGAGSILFGAAALRSRGLALPIGIHAAWNVGTWAQGQKSVPGIWVLGRRAGDDNPIIGTAIYLGAMLGAALIIAKWPRRREA